MEPPQKKVKLLAPVGSANLPPPQLLSDSCMAKTDRGDFINCRIRIEDRQVKLLREICAKDGENCLCSCPLDST